MKPCMPEPESLLLDVLEPGEARRVVLEDDGRVAYAYLLEQDKFVGDVWLYNVGPDPSLVDWKDRGAMPFQNPAKYCAAERLPRLHQDVDLRCEWDERGATVSVDGLVWARLERGSKPGWSRGATRSNRLAQPLYGRPRLVDG